MQQEYAADRYPCLRYFIGDVRDPERLHRAFNHIDIIIHAAALCPNCEIELTGVRPGEKMHEVMIPQNEARNTYEYDSYYIIQPAYRFFKRAAPCCTGHKVTLDFEYSSETNTDWLQKEELLEFVKTLQDRREPPAG